MAKASDHFKVVSVIGNKMILEVILSAPSPENRSTGTITKGEDGKDVKHKDGKNYVIGKAWGALPFRVNGKTPKINMSVMLPVSETAKEVMAEVTLQAPPVIPPAASVQEQPASVTETAETDVQLENE